MIVKKIVTFDLLLKDTKASTNIFVFHLFTFSISNFEFLL